MKTILEIQKLDRQIKMLKREVEKCPASMDFNNYKKILQEGRARFEQLEKQASEIVSSAREKAEKILQDGQAQLKQMSIDSAKHNEQVAQSKADQVLQELTQQADQTIEQYKVNVAKAVELVKGKII